MKLAFAALFSTFLGMTLLLIPQSALACETYEQPCGGNEDRSGDDVRDTDPVVYSPNDNERQDNDPGYPEY